MITTKTANRLYGVLGVLHMVAGSLSVTHTTCTLMSVCGWTALVCGAFLFVATLRA